MELVESTRADAYVVKNLYPLYLHDLSAFTGDRPNPHGILDEDPAVRSLADQMVGIDIWWQKPGVLYPFLIRVDDGRPAGFVMVATPPHVASGVDYMLHEFFILHAYRGTGLAQQAARAAFARFRGTWHAYVLPRNDRAIRFWTKVIADETAGRFDQRPGRTILGDRDLHIFSFDNRAGA